MLHEISFHYPKYLFAAVAAVLLCLSVNVEAEDRNWAVSSGDWSTPANWGGIEPTGNDNVYLNNGGTATITLTGEICKNLYLGSSSIETSGSIQMTGGDLSMLSQYIGYSGTGSFSQSGGSNRMTYDLVLAYASGSVGTYYLSGTASINSQSQYVGYSGRADFFQTGGTNYINGILYIGRNSDAVANYYLSGTGWVNAVSEYVAFAGTATFQQTGGTNGATNFVIGYDLNSNGTYHLSGTGTVAATDESIGVRGTGTFYQTSGTHLVNGYNNITGNLSLGSGNNGVGIYNLSGTGQLSCTNLHVGTLGTGTFIQDGGTNTVSKSLYIGENSGSIGTYQLNGSAQLSAAFQYVGYNSTATALFHQTGGTNTATYLSIGSSGQYNLLGGSLMINSGLDNNGTFDGGDSAAEIIVAANAIADFSKGTLKNVGFTSVTVSTNSLLIVPEGFDPTICFGQYHSQGFFHTAGTPLIVPIERTIRGWDSINDPVECQGTIIATSGGFINLKGGLTLSGNGSVNLGSGNLTTNVPTSGMTGGSLYVNNHYVGNSGTGTFTQSGGTSTAATQLVLGYQAGDKGTYQLSGTGQLSGPLCVGYRGEGHFIQTGGTHSTGLTLGDLLNSNGTYELSDTGKLLGGFAYIGNAGTGIFTQSGGSNTINGTLYLAYNSAGSGTYNLSTPGQLSAWEEYIGYAGTAIFNQSGGVHSVSGSLDIARSGTGTATYTLSGMGELSAANEYIGDLGPGTFLHSSGKNTIVTALYVGAQSVKPSSYNLTDVGQLSAPTQYIGYRGNGTFNQSGGTNTAATLILANKSGSKGTYNLNGGTLILKNLTSGSGTATFNFGGGILRTDGDLSVMLPISLTGSGGDATVDTAGHTMTLSGILSGPGGLRKIGSGTLTVTAANTYTGDTNVEKGILCINVPYLNDLAGVLVSSDAKLNLNYPGSDTVGILFLGGMPAAYGTWGSSSSAAMHIDDSHFSGTGMLNVIPEPSTLALLVMGGIGLIAYGWRRKK